tara:strand:+ start:886 stop:1173 length:288 start_codon:yes stop_codon:yes gene_type:complete
MILLFTVFIFIEINMKKNKDNINAIHDPLLAVIQTIDICKPNIKPMGIVQIHLEKFLKKIVDNVRGITITVNELKFRVLPNVEFILSLASINSNG